MSIQTEKRNLSGLHAMLSSAGNCSYGKVSFMRAVIRKNYYLGMLLTNA